MWVGVGCVVSGWFVGLWWVGLGCVGFVDSCAGIDSSGSDVPAHLFRATVTFRW